MGQVSRSSSGGEVSHAASAASAAGSCMRSSSSAVAATTSPTADAAPRPAVSCPANPKRTTAEASCRATSVCSLLP